MPTEDRPFPAVLDCVRPRDALDLMSWPWFSLAKEARFAPLAYRQHGQYLRITAAGPHRGLATIWDADILIWAVSQLTEAQDSGLPVSRRLTAPLYQILRFLGRGTSQRQYQLLAAALDRLATTAVETTLRMPASGAPAAFQLLESWRRGGAGIELVIPEWLFTSAITESRVLGIDARYFRLTGGVERWLWRLVRKHVGRQSTGWEIGLRALHARSGALSRPSDFLAALRRIAQRGTLPGYHIEIAGAASDWRLRFMRSAERVHNAGRGLVEKSGYSSTDTGTAL